MNKRLLGVLLALAMAVSLICVSALAADPDSLTTDGGTLASGSYVLNSDVKLTENIVIPTGANVTIDLNGHTLTGVEGGSVITVNGTLTLKDSAGTGTITGGTGTDIEDGSLIYCVGGGVYVTASGEFYMEGGTIYNNAIESDTADSRYGGGVYVEGYFLMEGGAISENTAYLGGGVAVKGNDAYFRMTDGEITDNVGESSSAANVSVTGSGGGVYVSGGVVALNGGTISGNTAVNGGGVTATASATIAVSRSTISDNTATNLGGGVYAATTNVTIKLSGAATITGNTVSGAPNNLYLKDGVTVTLDRALTGTVGVTTATPPTETSTVQITADSSYADASLAAFVSDDTDFEVQVNSTDGYLELAVAEVEPLGTIHIYNNMTLSSSLTFNYLIKTDDLTDAAGYTLTVTKTTIVNGAPVEETSEAMEFTEGTDFYDGYWVVKYDGWYTYEYGSTLTVTLTNANGTEVDTEVSYSSVEAYLIALSGSSNQNSVTIANAALTYCQATKDYFEAQEGKTVG